MLVWAGAATTTVLGANGQRLEENNGQKQPAKGWSTYFGVTI